MLETQATTRTDQEYRIDTHSVANEKTGATVCTVLDENRLHVPEIRAATELMPTAFAIMKLAASLRMVLEPK